MRITIGGNIFEGTPEEIKKMMTLMGAEFPNKEAEENGSDSLKVGDTAVITRTDYNCMHGFSEGDEVKIIESLFGEDDKDYRIQKINGHTTGYAPKEGGYLRKTEAEEVPTFREGDRVKALADGEDGDIKAGEVGKVMDTVADLEESDPYSIGVKTDDDYDYFRPQDLELVAEEEAPRFKVGDSVRVSVEGTPKYFWGSVKNGDIGVIKRIEDDFIKVDFPSQKYWTALPSELALLTDEEVEQAKREDSFTKAGRKPGEFKKGDIVRVSWSNNKGSTDELAEIYEGPIGRGAGGNYYLNGGEDVTLGNDIELIATVESRVDL